MLISTSKTATIVLVTMITTEVCTGDRRSRPSWLQPQTAASEPGWGPAIPCEVNDVVLGIGWGERRLLTVPAKEGKGGKRHAQGRLPHQHPRFVHGQTGGPGSTS